MSITITEQIADNSHLILDAGEVGLTGENSTVAASSQSPGLGSSTNGSSEGNGVYRRGDRPERRLRVALYSHDALGLGHLRRNLLIAQSLAESRLDATTLLITGAHEANFFTLPSSVDCLTLPRLRKSDAGDYTSGQLDISRQRLSRIRAQSIRSALEEFQPDLLIVDKVPCGAFGELLSALEHLRQTKGTRCVLGLRDVLDDVSTVRREWLTDRSVATIDECYDSVWVYGDQNVYDPVSEYGLPASVAAKVRFTGYLDQSIRLKLTGRAPAPAVDGRDTPSVACVVGGGQDGATIAEAFAAALPVDGVEGTVLAGPFMPRQSLRILHQCAARRKNLNVVQFTPEADLIMQRADRIVAMAGYNTVCSILSYRKRALVIPRATPRLEQVIRAQRLAELGLVDTLPGNDIDVPAMRAWLTSTDHHLPLSATPIDLGGLRRLVDYSAALLSENRQSNTHTHPLKV